MAGFKSIKKKAEKAVSIVEEKKINDTEVEEMINTSVEEEIIAENSSNDGLQEIGNIGGSAVKAQPRGIRYEAYMAPVPMFILPEDIRAYLLTNGFGTDVWKKDKEWLEKHNADMKMINKLKKFLSDRYNGVE